MENNKQNNSANEDCPEELRSSAHGVAEFDSVTEPYCGNDQLKSSGLRPLRTSGFGIEAAETEWQNNVSKPEKMHSVSISMPSSPIGDHIPKTKRVLFRDDDMILRHEIPSSSDMYNDVSSRTRQAKFYYQPQPKSSALNETVTGGKSPNLPVMNLRTEKLKDKRFDSFKTWAGKFERQLSNLRGKHHENEEEHQTEQLVEMENIPVDRYFDALEGPELDKLRASEEEILLPDDKKWPFLLRFPISSFGICLGLSSQAIMWKALASSESTKFLHVTPGINLVLWFISIALMATGASVYALKIVFYFEAVRREYYHPIRVNFFFAPWITLLFLFLGIPPSVAQTLHSSVWYILMAPIFCLELKIYGQWMSGGQRRLSKVANPSNHLSVVGNFVGALLGASMGLKEGPIFFFAVGLAHYIVLFVTLYQRLPTNETLPKELHPVFFLFVAAPSVASMAWARIQGSFDHGSRIAYFIGLFLYFSLAVRVNFFRGFRFSLAWWAYTFPMTGAAVATIRYSTVVTTTVTKTLTVILCIVATLTVSALLVTTIIHAFVLCDLFPNDIAIAISERRPKTSLRWYHRRSGSTDTNIKQFLKYSNPDDKDIEASADPPGGGAIHAI